MLGRLKMDVDECISEFKNAMKTAFERSTLPIDWRGASRLASTPVF
jgi:hypothetical protein